MEIKKFKEKLIAFDVENDQVNATDLLKAYNESKLPNQSNKMIADYLRLKSTKEYKEVLESDMGIPILKVNKGGINQGTWMHRLLAYDFAAWLSAKFRLFVFKVFDQAINEKLKNQQRQLDYFWDKSDQKDLY